MQTTPFLRRVLGLDAAASGATGLLLAVGAGPLSTLLGLETALMRPAGVFVVAYAAVIAWMATRTALPRAAVFAVVAVNVLWVVDSLALLAGGWAHPTAFGYVFVIGQAVAVAVFAELQVLALRRMPRMA